MKGKACPNIYKRLTFSQISGVPIPFYTNTTKKLAQVLHMIYHKGIFNVQAASVGLKVLGPATDIIIKRIIDNFIILNTPNLTSQRTARYCTSNYSGTGNDSIPSTTDFRQSLTQKKLPALHTDNTVYFCFKTIRTLAVRYGWAEAIFTQQNKSQVQNIFFLHPVIYSTQGLIQKMSQQDIPSLLQKN